MQLRLVAILSILFIIISGCDQKVKDANPEKAGTQPQAEQPEVVLPQGQSLQHEAAAAKFPSKLGLKPDERILHFIRQKNEIAETPGTLPIPQGARNTEDPAEYSLKSMSYLDILQENLYEIHGFYLAEDAPQRKVPGMPPRPIKRIRVTFEAGPAQAIDFGPDGQPKLKELRDYQFDEIDNTDDKLPSRGAKRESALEMIFDQEFAIRPGNAPYIWSLPEVVKVKLIRGTGVRMTVDILDPELYPTINPIDPLKIGLIVPDRSKSIDETRVLREDPIPEGPACYGNKRGQRVCLYASKNVEFYVTAPYNEISYHAHWDRLDQTIMILQYPSDTEPRKIQLSGKEKGIDFKDLGRDWELLNVDDPKNHRFGDIARAASSDEEITPNDFKSYWLTQIIPGGEKEVIALAKNGNVYVFKRADYAAPMVLMYKIIGKGKKARMVWDATRDRTYIGLRDPQTKKWETSAYVPNEKQWVVVERERVPW